MPDDDTAKRSRQIIPQFAGFHTPGILQALDPGFELEPYISDPSENGEVEVPLENNQGKSRCTAVSVKARAAR